MDIEGFNDYKKAGRIHTEALHYGSVLIKEGESLLEVTKKIEAKIASLGGGFAFPPQISLNEIAAHFYPLNDNTALFKAGDVASLDIGIHINGFIADGAVTVDVGKQHSELVKASRDALNAALRLCVPGQPIGEIGKTIQETIESFGFRPVRNLSGHSVGQFLVHGPPSIPNFDNGDGNELTEGMVIAIEPFASTGAGMIHEKGEPTLFQLVGKKPVRDMITRSVLKEINTYHELPFTSRWLI